MALILADITERLERHRQRATYGAIAGLLGLQPRWLMRGCDRSHRNSWVVNRVTGMPTHYTAPDCHPELEANSRVIVDVDELRIWLRTHD